MVQQPATDALPPPGAEPRGSVAGEQERVPLDGCLAEFRTALELELEAARRDAASSAIGLQHGQRIGSGAGRSVRIYCCKPAGQKERGRASTLVRRRPAALTSIAK